jgi:MerR family redox-sensitive transcriptional activator SoxR
LQVAATRSLRHGRCLAREPLPGAPGALKATGGGRRATVPRGIRYCESIGVLPTPRRVSGQRRYDTDVLHRLAIIEVAQRAGFSLTEIRDLISAGDKRASERIRTLASSKLPDIDGLIARAQPVRRWLEMATACDCDTIDMCSYSMTECSALPRSLPVASTTTP